MFPKLTHAIRGNSPGPREKTLLTSLIHRCEVFHAAFRETLELLMTSISAASASTYQSPLQRLQDELQSEVTSGAISSADQDALPSALTDIDSSLQASRASDQASGTRPGDLKSKIDDLINGEVSSGKLTSDQATELQGVFKVAFADGPAGSGGAAGGPGGA